MEHVDEQLIADHHSLDKLLQQLKRALAQRELEDTRAKLDLFWARLAVHIRAEHLHLFPLVLNSLDTMQPLAASAPTTAAAQASITSLQTDHDFFMSELALAVKIIRGLTAGSDPSGIAAALDEIAEKVDQVARRLVRHNEMEEDQIYRWASTVLSNDEQVKLWQQISRELQNRPPRFTVDAWPNVVE